MRCPAGYRGERGPLCRVGNRRGCRGAAAYRRILQSGPARRRVAGSLATAACADHFPSLSRTGFLGSESAALRSLFSGLAFARSLGAFLLQPLLGLKAIELNVRPEQARREEAIDHDGKT